MPKQSEFTAFGTLVERYRKQRGITRDELAKDLRTSTVTIWKQLTGRADVSDRDRAAYQTVLRIPAEEVMIAEMPVTPSGAVSIADLPRHLMIPAGKFEIEAMEMGATEEEMAYVRLALRAPEAVTMFRMGHDGRELSTEDQVTYMESHIAKLRALIKERVKQRRGK